MINIEEQPKYPLEGNRTPILRTGILCVIHYTTRGRYNNNISLQMLFVRVNKNEIKMTKYFERYFLTMFDF